MGKKNKKVNLKSAQKLKSVFKNCRYILHNRTKGVEAGMYLGSNGFYNLV